MRYGLFKIGEADTNVDNVEGWNVSRIRNVRDNSTGVVKIKTRSTEERDNVLELSSKMKDLVEPWYA